MNRRSYKDQLRNEIEQVALKYNKNAQKKIVAMHRDIPFFTPKQPLQPAKSQESQILTEARSETKKESAVTDDLNIEKLVEMKVYEKLQKLVGEFNQADAPAVAANDWNLVTPK